MKKHVYERACSEAVKDSKINHSVRQNLSTYVISAMLNDSLHFFMDEFDASDRRFEKSLDLSLDQQLERHLRHEES